MSAIQSIMSATAGVLAIIGYIPYIVSILHRATRPAKATWIIWASLDIITLLSMYAKGAVNGQIAAVTLGTSIVAILALRYGTPGWTKLDLICLGGAVVGVVVWQWFGNPTLAIVTSLSVIFIGSVPTFVSTWHDPSKEDKLAWTIYWFSCIAAVAAIPAWSLPHAAQPLTFFAVTAIMMCLLYVRPLTRKTAPQTTPHTMHLDPEPFERMRSGTKLIEARLTVDKHRQPRNLKVGDGICFQRRVDATLVLRVEVVALLYYPAFAALVDDFDSKRYFGRDSKEELLANLRRRYSEADERTYGVLGIKVKVLND